MRYLILSASLLLFGCEVARSDTAKPCNGAYNGGLLTSPLSVKGGTIYRTTFQGSAHTVFVADIDIAPETSRS